MLAITGTAVAGERLPGDRYNGSHIGGAVFGGASVLGGGWRDRTGWLTGASLRVASIMQVVDVQLDYAYDRNRTDAALITRHATSLSINVHPLFLRILVNDWLNYVLSGMYLQLGGGFEVGGFEGRRGLAGRGREGVSGVLHVGLGADMPLHDPNYGWGLWLGVLWRWRFVFNETGLDDARKDFDGHWFVVSLAFRFNNISFMRFPRPPEVVPAK